jgi:hypothetical protein
MIIFKKSIISIISLIMLLFILGCSNTLPQNTIEFSIQSLEEVCQGFGYLSEKQEYMFETEVYCVFPDGSSCRAIDFYEGKCYPIPKINDKIIQLNLKNGYNISSIAIKIEYDNSKLIPLLKNPQESFLQGSSSKEILYMSNLDNLILEDKDIIIGSSANRKEILFAVNLKESLIVKGMIAEIPIKTSNLFNNNDLTIKSVFLVDFKGNIIEDDIVNLRISP